MKSGELYGYLFGNENEIGNGIGSGNESGYAITIMIPLPSNFFLPLTVPLFQAVVPKI